MLVSHDRLKMVLRKVGVVREQLALLCVAPPGPVLSVMDLHYVVEQVYGLSIEMKDVDFQAVYLRGHVERYPNKAFIRVRANLSEYDKRLVTVKELSHLIVDEKDDWSGDAVATLEGLIEESRAIVALEHKKVASHLESEGLALLAAVELLYPWEYRQADQARIDADEATLSSIALEHQVPAYVVDEALTKEPLLSGLRQEAYQDVGLAAE